MTAVIVCAAVASIVAIVIELAAVKSQGARAAWEHLLFAASTIVGSWLLLPTLFALNYASLYYGGNTQGGLVFPQPEPVADGSVAAAAPAYAPHYDDFLYFSFTIAVACQTSDVAVLKVQADNLPTLRLGDSRNLKPGQWVMAN